MCGGKSGKARCTYTRRSCARDRCTRRRRHRRRCSAGRTGRWRRRRRRPRRWETFDGWTVAVRGSVRAGSASCSTVLVRFSLRSTVVHAQHVCPPLSFLHRTPYFARSARSVCLCVCVWKTPSRVLFFFFAPFTKRFSLVKVTLQALKKRKHFFFFRVFTPTPSLVRKVFFFSSPSRGPAFARRIKPNK